MLRLPPRLSTVNTLAFSPDGRHLLAVGRAGGLGGLIRFRRLALYDLADPAAEPPARIDFGLDPTAGHFLPDGRLLGVDNRGSWLAVRPDGTAADRSAAGAHGRYEPAVLAPDGSRFAQIGPNAVVCRPVAPGVAGWRAELDDREEASAVAFSPGAEAVAVAVKGWPWAEREWGVQVYAGDSGTHLAWADAPADTARLAWSPDARYLVAAAPAGFAVIDPYPWAAVARRPAPGAGLTAAAFHPAGGTFVTADAGGMVHEWEVGEWDAGGDDGRPARAFDWGVGPVSALAVSPDGTLGAVAGRGGQVAVWDM